jgi:hypothetical protein
MNGLIKSTQALFSLLDSLHPFNELQHSKMKKRKKAAVLSL